MTLSNSTMEKFKEHVLVSCVVVLQHRNVLNICIAMNCDPTNFTSFEPGSYTLLVFPWDTLMLHEIVHNKIIASN